MKIFYYRLSQTLNTKGLQRMNNLSIRLLKFLVFSWSTNTFDERATKNTDNNIWRSLKLRKTRVRMREASSFEELFRRCATVDTESFPVSYN